MKTIRIAYVDFWSDLEPDNFKFTQILNKKYNVIIDNDNPEYIFCSHFGNDYLNYDCIRILFLGEAKAPDFNVYDYAMGFDDIVFGDRYLQYPLFLLYKTWELALNKHLLTDEEYLSKNKFCNTVVSNGNGAEIRDKFFDELSEYKAVDSGGRYRNNLPDGKPISDKLEFQKAYKYSFAFENSSFPGYVTEKIIDAWAAGTIPLYWGAPDVDRFFNTDAYIDCTRMKSVDELIEKIEIVENDNSLYLSMMKTPIIKEGLLSETICKDKYLEDFLYSIFDQNLDDAKRRNSSLTMWGRNYENHLKKWKKIESNKWLRKIKRMVNR